MQAGGTWNLKPYSMAVSILYPPQEFNDNSPLGTMWVLSYDPNRDRERDREGHVHVAQSTRIASNVLFGNTFVQYCAQF